MKVDPRALSPDASYQWMAATILPRPIAWVSTLNDDGSANLAPFSFFTGVGADPPTCLICVSRKGRVDPGAKKDTWANVERTGELVINAVPDALANAMNITSKEYPRGVDEFEAAGVTKTPCERVAPPRVAEAPVAMECSLQQILEVGRPGEGTAVIICEILMWHVHDDVLAGGRVDFGKLDLVGRLGGAFYSRTRDRFDLVRPK
jgi:flavin reductase (DIM6/NTAB) family NADH-FMN oxidoreductase RutF